MVSFGVPILPIPMTALLRSLLSPDYRTLRYRAGWAAFAGIVIVGSIPGARADIGQVASGYVLHATAYAGITFLLLTGSIGTLPARAARAVGTVAAMGAVDEGVQSFLPYRNGTVGDWMIDVTSALACAAACCVLLRRTA
jgi:hypothetical protein